MHSIKRRIWKITAAMVAAMLILVAIGVGMFRFAAPLVPGLRVQTEQAAADALGWPVQIGEMDLRWNYFGPMLVLHDIQLLSPETRKPLISASRLDIVFRPGDLFQEGDFRPSLIRLHEPMLAVERDVDGNILLSDYQLTLDPDSRLDWRDVMRRLLKHGRLMIIDATLHYSDARLDIQDWTLQHFELDAASDGKQHEFTGSFVPPGPLGEQAAFSLTAIGDAGEPENWDWQLDIGARRVRFDWLHEQLHWAGDGSFAGTIDVSASLQGHGLASIRGEGEFAADEISYQSVQPSFEESGGRWIEHIGFDWIVESDADGFALDLEDLTVTRDDHVWPKNRWRIRATLADEALQTFEVHAGYLRLEDSTLAFDWLPKDWLPGEVREALQGLQPKGDVRNVALDLADLATNQPQWRMDATIEDLDLLPWKGAPGIKGLGIDFTGTSAAGTARFSAKDGRLDARPLFRDDFVLGQLNGRVSWHREAQAMVLSVDSLDANNDDAVLSGTGTIVIPDDGPVRSDLSGKVFNAQVSATHRYLPVESMVPELVDWLDHATPKGIVPEADWVLRGALEDFPWSNDKGVFDIRFPITGLTLLYQDNWPRVTDAVFDVHFHNEGLDVVVREGRSSGLSIAGVTAGFDNLADAFLVVKGPVKGNLSNAFRFLSASPLQDSLQGMLDNLTVDGPFAADIDLKIPLLEVESAEVGVVANLEKVKVGVGGIPWPVEELTGVVRVTEKSVHSEGLQGRFTDHDLAARISSEEIDGRPGPVSIELTAVTPASELGNFLPSGWGPHLQGRFDWQGLLRLNDPESPAGFHIESDMVGMTSTLPAPLQVVSPVTADIRLPTDEQPSIDVGFIVDAMLGGQLRFLQEGDDERWQLERGEIASGGVSIPEMPATRGLVVSGRVSELPVIEWIELGRDAANGADESRNDLLRGIDLTADKLLLGELEFSGQRMSGERVQDEWMFSMQGPIQGSVRLPTTFEIGRVAHLNLDHLAIRDEHPEVDDDPAATLEDAAPDPRLFPSIELDIGKLSVGELDFGHVTGRLQRTSVGIFTDNLVAEDDAFHVDMSGRWEFVEGEHYTSVQGRLETSNLAQTFSRLGYQGALESDEASITAKLSWPASPLAWSIGSIEGNIGFAFKDGQLREVSPGAGRMLGLLSISALPRRLFLDFSDLFEEGLAFDELKGDYIITNGNAYTTNIRLEGASITAYLVGRTGLRDRDYDQVAIVDPGVSSSIPVAGYLAAGPTVGAALLVASQLLKTPLSDITQVKYRITGSWDEPLVEKVESAPEEKKE